jgi:hypothetical protein
MVAIISVLGALVISLLIMRVATVALTATGLAHEAARFQARSALTGVGFTTGEAESVVEHPVRRRIVMVLMLLGNAGLVTIVASLMLSFVNSGGADATVVRIVLLVTGLGSILVLARSKALDRRLNKLIGRALSKWTDLDTRDYAGLLQLTRDYAVMELLVEPEDWMNGKTLADARLSDEGVLVLGISHAGGDYVGAPRGSTVASAGDTLILYGRSVTLAELDERGAGGVGDSAHESAVAQQRRLREDEASGPMPPGAEPAEGSPRHP